MYKVQDNRAVPGMPLTLALKEISVGSIPDPVDRDESAAAFRSEVRLLMSLNHPYLTQVVNFFAENDNYYLVMDFVDGETLLKARERANGPLPVNQALDWFWQLCDVLVYLHGLDPPIIFRDMKPGNVMITHQGIVKLIDFGIARFFKKEGAAADTRALGTPGYAPPEQYGRSQTDERSDIYSLGVTIYELLTNVNPDEHIFNLPPPLTLNPAIPSALAAMLVKMTQLEPEARYQTIIAVRSDLAKIYPKPAHATPPQTQRILAGQAPPATPPPPPEPPPPSVVPQPARAQPAPTPAPAPAPARDIPGVDERYLATPAPLPTERKVTAQPSQPVKPVSTSQTGQSTAPANAKLKTQNSKLAVPLLLIALIAVIVGGSYFGLLPFSLPFIGQASHAPAPDTLYPATVAAPAGVTNPELNSRSPRGQWWMPGYDWGGTNFSHESGPTIAGTSRWDYPINTPTEATSNLIVASEGYYLTEPKPGISSDSTALYLDTNAQPGWSFDLPPAPLEFNRLAYAKGGNATFLYVQDSLGDIYASDPAAQGRTTWQYTIGPASDNAPVIANGVLYASTPLTITALDAASGKQLWQEGGAFQSAPLLSPDAASIYIVQAGKLTALDPASGKAKWQSSDPLPTQAISATFSLLATQDTIYLGTALGLVIPFDPGSGDELSQFSVGSAVVGFAAAGNSLYVTVAGNELTARDAASGFERWSYTLGGAPVGSPIVVGDDLYVLSKDSKLTILNARSGALVKNISLPDAPLGDGEYVNSTFYYFGEKGLHALR